MYQHVSQTKKVSEEDELAKADFTVIADDVRDALAEKHEESKNNRPITVFENDQVSLVSYTQLNYDCKAYS